MGTKKKSSKHSSIVSAAIAMGLPSEAVRPEAIEQAKADTVLMQARTEVVPTIVARETAVKEDESGETTVPPAPTKKKRTTVALKLLVRAVGSLGVSRRQELEAEHFGCVFPAGMKTDLAIRMVAQRFEKTALDALPADIIAALPAKGAGGGTKSEGGQGARIVAVLLVHATRSLLGPRARGVIGASVPPRRRTKMGTEAISKKMTDKHNVAQIGGALASGGGALLGSIVWSDIELAGSLIDRRVVRAALLAEGLPPEMQPESKSVEWSFGRAVSAWRGLKGKTHELQREEKRSENVLIIGSSGTGLGYAASALGVMRPGATDIEVTLPSNASDAVKRDVERFRRIVQRFQHYMDAPEFQQTVRIALLDWFGGTRLRKHGSVYWCPASSAKDLEKLVRVVEGVGRCVLPSLPVTDAHGARGRVGAPLAGAFERELHDLMRSMVEMTKSGKEIRDTTWIARGNDLDAIRGRVEIARSILGDRVLTLGSLMDQINSAQKRAIANAKDTAWALDFDAVAPSDEEAADDVGDFES